MIPVMNNTAALASGLCSHWTECGSGLGDTTMGHRPSHKVTAVGLPDPTASCGLDWRLL
jgi:hypothetical protein